MRTLARPERLDQSGEFCQHLVHGRTVQYKGTKLAIPFLSCNSGELLRKEVTHTGKDNATMQALPRDQIREKRNVSSIVRHREREFSVQMLGAGRSSVSMVRVGGN